MKKKTILLGLVAAFSILTAVPAFAGQWQKDSMGWWYLNDNNTYPANGWQSIGGVMYYFDNRGYLLTNTVTPDGYTVDKNGAWVSSIPQRNSNTSAYGYEALDYAGRYESYTRVIEFSAYTDTDTDEIGVAAIYDKQTGAESFGYVYLCTSAGDWDMSAYDAVYEIRSNGSVEYMMFYQQGITICMDYNSPYRNYDSLEMTEHYEP